MSEIPVASNPSAAYPRGGTWSYDGSLEGLILLAHRAYSEGSYPEAVANALAVEGELFAFLGPEPLSGSLRGTEADAAHSELRAFSGDLIDMIIRVWMSEAALELPLFRLCAQAGLHGTEVLADYGSADLRALSRAARRVSCEIHKLTGLARFSPVSGIFVAPLEPDANIVAALVPHFARRFADEDFAIVDVRRRLAIARVGRRFESIAGEGALAYLPQAAGDEDAMLWRAYFKAAENPSRRNPLLQRRLMPQRYWKYLPELRPDLYRYD